MSTRRSMVHLKTRFFTLLEILIVMALMVLLVGIVGWNLRGGIKAQAFNTQVDRILKQLRMSQDILMLLNIDTKLDFEGKEIEWIPVGTTNEVYDKFLAKEKTPLTSFSSIEFESELDGEKSLFTPESGKITLSFLDRGFRLPYGVLKMVSVDNVERYIYLPGYPSPLDLQNTPPDVTQIKNKERDFRDRLTKATWTEINVRKN